MANATSKVPSTVTNWDDNIVYRKFSAATATYYMGCMMAVGADGYSVKCDDTAGLMFDGILFSTKVGLDHVDVTTSDTAPYKEAVVKRPFRFGMKIAAATIADIGSPVYALYDNEVALTGLSASIQVGWIDEVPSSTFVIIRPIWLGAPGNSTFDGNTLTFSGATTVNVVAVPDNLADALSIKEGSNKYVTIVTTNSSEAVLLGKPLEFPSAGFIADSNRNELIIFPATVTSAVNEITVSNAATTAAPSVAATGGDTNLSLDLIAKGTAVGVVRARAIFVDKASISTAVNDTATVTIAQLQAGVLDCVPTAAATYTLPTAALLVAGIANARVGDRMVVQVNNRSAGANTITVAAGANGTLRGTATIAQSVCRTLVFVLTNVTGSSETYTVFSQG